MDIISNKKFANGEVFALKTKDGYLTEVTDTFLPSYTKDAVGRNQNKLDSYKLGDKSERWMIGVSCMSGCPVNCKFCATGNMSKWRNLTHQEIVEQVEFIINRNTQNPNNSYEFKINYTRMGEPFLNIENVRKAIEVIDSKYKNVHHYVSTVGIKGSDFSWVKDNITLQISVHSLDENRRDNLIPIKNKMTLKELGEIRTKSNLKTTVNMTLVDYEDFDINILRSYFDPDFFFIKLSPININEVSEKNNMGKGVVESINLI